MPVERLLQDAPDLYHSNTPARPSPAPSVSDLRDLHRCVVCAHSPVQAHCRDEYATARFRSNDPASCDSLTGESHSNPFESASNRQFHANRRLAIVSRQVRETSRTRDTTAWESRAT